MEINEKEIIDLYLSGIGSTNISVRLGIQKYKILKVLNKNGVVRNRLLGDEFYKNFWEEDGMWCGYWVCNSCSNEIKFCTSTKSLLNRNLKKKNICKKCSLEKQKGSGNPFYGKKHKESTKKKISKNREGKCTGDCSHMKQNSLSKQKVINALNKFYSDPEKSRKTRLKHSLTMKKNILLGKLKTINKSKKEDEIKQFLTNLNYNVIQHHRVKTKICDLFIPSLNLIIEYNGDYWHCNPNKYGPEFFNQKKNKYAKEIWLDDENRLQLIKNCGYNLEVIWEEDLKYNNNKILDILKNYDKQRKNDPCRSD